VCHFYSGLRREIQDIVYYKDFNTTNQLFQLAMLAEKELQGRQQKNQTNIGDNLNQVLARVEQAFTSGRFHRYSSIFTTTSYTHFGAW
jgi:hypothetical protein